MVVNSGFIGTWLQRHCYRIYSWAGSVGKDRAACSAEPLRQWRAFLSRAFSLSSSEGAGSYSSQVHGTLRIVNNANLHWAPTVNRSMKNNAESRVSTLDFVFLGNGGVFCISQYKEAPSCIHPRGLREWEHSAYSLPRPAYSSVK